MDCDTIPQGMPTKTNVSLRFLLLGDALAILVVTLIGFTTHGLSTTTPRWLTTFLPMLLSWMALAPWFGVFRPAIFCRSSQTWRAPLAIAFAAPLAALLRSLWLGTTIVPVFVLVLAATSALGIFLWRLAWSFWCKRIDQHG
jgi:hypothetical protein